MYVVVIFKNMFHTAMELFESFFDKIDFDVIISASLIFIRYTNRYITLPLQMGIS